MRSAGSARSRAVVMVTAAVAALAAALAPAAPAYADSVREAQWHLRYLHVAEAHARTQGDGVIVAVLDSGADAAHPDLNGSLLPGVRAAGEEAPSEGDPDGRGTALAGLVAGHGHGADGGDGVLGLAPKAKVLPVTVTVTVTAPAPPASPSPGDDSATMARGIDLAVARGATVICVGRGVPDSPALQNAVQAALRSGAVIVATDGNRAGEDVPPYPAAYPGVVAAVPLNRNLTVTVASHSGRALGLSVPGDDIVSTNTGGGYRIDAGSGAVGVLAGAVALVRAAYPRLAGDEVVHRMTATAADAGAPGRDELYGYGRLDLLAALTQSVPLLHPAPSASAGPALPGPAASASARAAANRPADRPRGPFGWLVTLPLLAVLGSLGWYAYRAERDLGARLQAGRRAGAAARM